MLTFDAVQNQAVDRIYRLGQTKPVQTVRFVMKDTIETNMLKIQQRKMELASCVSPSFVSNARTDPLSRAA